MEKTDLFKKLIEEGILKFSGLDINSNSYRVIEFRGKNFRLTLTEE